MSCLGATIGWGREEAGAGAFSLAAATLSEEGSEVGGGAGPTGGKEAWSVGGGARPAAPDSAPALCPALPSHPLGSISSSTRCCTR